ncbi:MAG TPA: NADP-dependent malic enzyme [Candidatus Saccharibacteria bacterium]|mgnify:CR=1 FL=1|nr:NADP-dependent malic enzyme [Candidatus Saccharibacteria bacterium]
MNDDLTQQALAIHKKYKGKISIKLKDDDQTKEKLGLYYTPGVGRVSTYVAEHPEELKNYSWVNNLVAVISNGTAVLGLGDLGPYGAMPVMEGKSMLFKKFADIDSVPIVINSKDPKEVIKTIEDIAPSFGAINLEDFAAPACFEIEEELKAKLNIPVFHDDQHGTAIVVLAGLINALKLSGKKLEQIKIVIVGAGAAGVAIAKLLHLYGARQILSVDRTGVINQSRQGLNQQKTELSLMNATSGNLSLSDAVEDADVFIGVSAPGILTTEMIKKMNSKPVIFALANPDPEILPNDATAAGAFIIATGRSDFPNQVNNALAFPGIFRGALDNNVKKITDAHKIAAAEAIASFVPESELNPEKIIPSIFDSGLMEVVAGVIV